LLHGIGLNLNLINLYNFYLSYFRCGDYLKRCLNIYKMFRAQADWTLTHRSHKDRTEHNTSFYNTRWRSTDWLTDQVITEWMTFSFPGDTTVSIRCSGRLISLHNEHSLYIGLHMCVCISVTLCSVQSMNILVFPTEIFFEINKRQDQWVKKIAKIALLFGRCVYP
jgi:hypothetical protein